MNEQFSYWSESAERVIAELKSSTTGLSSSEAKLRKKGPVKTISPGLRNLLDFLSQFKNPLTLLLVFGLILSSILGEVKESIIIFVILFASALLSHIQQGKASRAAERLKGLIGTTTKVKRDNKTVDINPEDVVQGDVVLLDAGDLIPADCLLLDLKDLYVNESVLTGESYPAEKKAGPVERGSSVPKKTNVIFRGTYVISGTATAIAVNVGAESELGKLETGLLDAKAETVFEKGVKNFSQMLMKVGLFLTALILIVNLFLGRNPLESVLFSLAISLGLTPELLPAIMTITLSAGARRMTEKKVIVKKLSSVQNLGAIDVLCCDKTGTLTEGILKVESCISADGKPSEQVRQFAFLNALYESGYSNPMDVAIREQLKCDVNSYSKFDEVPFDFVRRRLSVVVAKEKKHSMITKGAVKNILEVCTSVSGNDGSTEPIANVREKVLKQFETLGKQGKRIIGVAFKDVTNDPVINKDDETDMIFCGFVVFNDPPKKGIADAISALNSISVNLKVISGDNALVSMNIARQLNIPVNRILSGSELHSLSNEALLQRIDDVDIFSEVEPTEKERIVRMLQKKGHAVGFLGDGINDSAALRAADVGISVNNAVDIAKEASDMILLEKDLKVIRDGVLEGRKTYFNTLKYIFITMSANLGNMCSLAISSMFLPFLPLLPSQVLLTNLFSDIPALAIASDEVDAELLQKPRQWNVKLIKKFMFVFGFESSLFDFITFFVLLLVYHTSVTEFQSGWFVESVVSEILILLVIRTRRSVFKSRLSLLLMGTSLGVFLLTLALPYFASELFGFSHLPFTLMAALLGIAFVYAFTGELTKKVFFKRVKF